MSLIWDKTINKSNNNWNIHNSDIFLIEKISRFAAVLPQKLSSSQEEFID